jgi:hypothetical protein
MMNHSLVHKRIVRKTSLHPPRPSLSLLSASMHMECPQTNWKNYQQKPKKSILTKKIQNPKMKMNHCNLFYFNVVNGQKKSHKRVSVDITFVACKRGTCSRINKPSRFGVCSIRSSLPSIAAGDADFKVEVLTGGLSNVLYSASWKIDESKNSGGITKLNKASLVLRFNQHTF